MFFFFIKNIYKVHKLVNTPRIDKRFVIFYND